MPCAARPRRGRDANRMRTDPRTEPLRHRPDFNEVLAQVDDLSSAEAGNENEAAPLEDKVGARRIILTALEAVSGPLPPIPFNRRTLARAALKTWPEPCSMPARSRPRGPLDEALAERQRLVEERPNNEQLRADLLQSQVSRGDWLAAAGRLKEAGAAWEAGLVPLEADFQASPDRFRGMHSLARRAQELEADFQASPDRFPLRAALADGLRQVGDQYGKLGLLAEALRYYRRAFAIEAPAAITPWQQYALLMAEAGDTEGFKALARRLANAKELTDARRDSVSIEWQEWVPAVARAGPGQGPAGQARPVGLEEQIANGMSVALAEHRLGHPDAARSALRQADLAADRMTRNAAVDRSMRLVNPDWPDWVYFRLLRRAAHQTIEGKSLPDSPYDRLFRGRVLFAFGQVEGSRGRVLPPRSPSRPHDVDLWLARARSLRQARPEGPDGRRPGQSPSAPIRPTRGRGSRRAGCLAELGEHAQADAAFARASALARDELDQFLVAGWWVAGPYPEPFDRQCPPETDPDPSRPLAAVGEMTCPRWQAVSAAPNRDGSGWEPPVAGKRTSRSTPWPMFMPTGTGLPRVSACKPRTPASG